MSNKLPVKKGKAAIVPTLPKGNDKEVATKLQELVKDANDGLRRIIIAGLFIEQISTELKHGQLGPWLKAYCPDVTWETTCRWRSLARNVAETVGFKFDAESNLDLPKMLALPAGKVPEAAREVCRKIGELIDGKTAKQLFFEFKQAEEDASGTLAPKVGRMKGCAPTTAVQRAESKNRDEEAHTEIVNERCEALAGLMDELGNARFIGMATDADLDRVITAHAALGDYLRNLKARRAGK